MRITTLIMMLMFLAVVVNAETVTEGQYLAELEAANVNFIYVSDGRITLVKTDETAEAVDALVQKKPAGLEVTVVTYKDTGQRQPGWKIEYDE